MTRDAQTPDEAQRFTPALHASAYPHAVVLSRLWLAAAVVVAVWVAPLASATLGTLPARQPPTIPALERNFANALAKARTTLVVRLHKHRTNTPQRYVTATEWVDLGNGDQRFLAYDASGRLETDTSRSFSATSTGGMSSRIVTVAYRTKTWSAHAGSSCGGYTGRACPVPLNANAACNCEIDPLTDFATVPDMALVGQETIDGEPTFHLAFTVTQPEPSTTDLWIDSSTYLPVHDQIVVPESPRATTAYTVSNDFTWLPRTRANLARFTVVIPRGFKHSSA